MQKILILILTITLSCGCTNRKNRPISSKQQAPNTTAPISDAELKWTEVSTPFPATAITSLGDIFWICGADEMVASSANGGTTWRLEHQKANGDLLLNIAFVNQQVGHAAGTGGLLLSTSDGGKTWRTRHAVSTIRAFSFADLNNGIAFIGGRLDHPPFSDALLVDGTVSLTHDGGKHWEDVAGLDVEELHPFTALLSLSALDHLHYLMIRRQPEIEDAFVASTDGGRTWKLVHPRNDESTREFPRTIFTHLGEYWVSGFELVNRQQGGGYTAPLTLHSRDGEEWQHGPNGSNGYCASDSVACVMWGGGVVQSYSERPKFWHVPQDGSLSYNWAIAGDRICTIGTGVKCGPAILTAEPQPRAVLHGVQHNRDPSAAVNVQFVPDCVGCGVHEFKLSPGLRWAGDVIAKFLLAPDGTVSDVLVEGTADDRLRAEIARQVQKWVFEAPAKDRNTDSLRRNVTIHVRCLDAPDAPGIDGCRLLVPRKSSH